MSDNSIRTPEKIGKNFPPWPDRRRIKIDFSRMTTFIHYSHGNISVASYRHRSCVIGFCRFLFSPYNLLSFRLSTTLPFRGAPLTSCRRHRRPSAVAVSRLPHRHERIHKYIHTHTLCRPCQNCIIDIIFYFVIFFSFRVNYYCYRLCPVHIEKRDV